MTPDSRNDYVLRCNRFTLLLGLTGLLLAIVGSWAGGFYLGRWSGPGPAGSDPWSVLAVPTGAPVGLVLPPEGDAGFSPAVGGAEPARDLSATVAVEPAATRELPAAGPGPAAWCVQLTTRSERAPAEREAAELTARGLQARVETAGSANGPRYLVRLGDFPRRADAEQYAAALANRGLITDFIVVEK